MRISVVRVTTSKQRAICEEILEADRGLGHIDVSNAQLWAAVDPDGEVLAMAGMEYDEETRHADMICCVVSPHARGRGLQQRLIRARVAWARKQGAQTLETYASIENTASLVSLLKCGFRPKSEQTIDEFLTVEFPDLS